MYVDFEPGLDKSCLINYMSRSKPHLICEDPQWTAHIDKKIMKGNGRTTLYYVIKDLQWVPRGSKGFMGSNGCYDFPLHYYFTFTFPPFSPSLCNSLDPWT
jgi:hypothetical protein